MNRWAIKLVLAQMVPRGARHFRTRCASQSVFVKAVAVDHVAQVPVIYVASPVDRQDVRLTNPIKFYAYPFAEIGSQLAVQGIPALELGFVADGLAGLGA